MLNVFDEFESVIKTMEKQGIPYALCGGLAVGVHTEIRATKDIDLLLLADDVERAKEALLSCGFQFFTEPMLFANSRIELHKLTKIEPRGRDYLFLDLMVIKTSEWKTISNPSFGLAKTCHKKYSSKSRFWLLIFIMRGKCSTSIRK